MSAAALQRPRIEVSNIKELCFKCDNITWYMLRQKNHYTTPQFKLNSDTCEYKTSLNQELNSSMSLSADEIWSYIWINARWVIKCEKISRRARAVVGRWFVKEKSQALTLNDSVATEDQLKATKETSPCLKSAHRWMETAHPGVHNFPLADAYDDIISSDLLVETAEGTSSKRLVHAESLRWLISEGRYEA